jgi:hypothetical protein
MTHPIRDALSDWIVAESALPVPLALLTATYRA